MLAWVVWFGSVALALIFWTLIFQRAPSPGMVVAVFVAFGGPLKLAFRRFGPALPMDGEAPEEIAAEAFFADRDVRPDDHRFERSLEP